MYILTQILTLGDTNLIINHFLSLIKDKLHDLLDFFINNFNKNRYIDIFTHLQEFANSSLISFLTNYFESLDKRFKDSLERKKQFHINKSNVERTIVTIFGELTFKRTLYINKKTHKYYFYLDDILGLESYKTYDPIIRGILINDSVNSSPNNTYYHSSLNTLNIKNILNNNIPKVSRQAIYNFKKEVKIRNIRYKEIEVNKTLYVMVDEKWIHMQDKNNPNKKKWIMSKCFVTFTRIETKGKRDKLIGRHIFITSSNNPWKDFMNEIYKIYNFEKIETINLLSDAGSWILSGAHELKLYTNNKIIINTCEFHVKQKINRSTTDKDLRITIANIIYENEDKQAFIQEMNKLIENAVKETRKQKITEYKNYILKHWKGIINMKYSLCKSSMEAHIQHCIASVFSSVPKAYSKNNIETYLKLQEMKLNGINLFEYYLETYNSSDDYIYSKEKEVDFSIFDKKSTSNLAYALCSNGISKALYGLSHPCY